MLQNIRNNVQGTMAKVVIAIIIVPFALFGIDSLFGSGGPPPVAKVNGKPISELELNNAISLQQRQIIAMLDGRADPALLDQDRLRGPVLQRMIRERLLLDSARQIGMVVPEKMLNESIVALPQFQENGQFSIERYQSVLRMQGLTPAGFKEELRKQLLMQQLLQGISGSSFLSDRELADVAELLEQTRNFSYVVIDTAALQADLELSDEELEAYYRAHSDAFERPEQVRVSYIDLQGQDFYEPVDEDQLQAELERLQEEWGDGVQRHAAHILVEVGDDVSAAKKRAEELYASLQAGADFAELAQEHSADAGSRQFGGDLGISSGDAFPPEFEAALADLALGEVSPPVRTDAGYHLIKLLDIQEGDTALQQDLVTELRDQLQRQAAAPRLISLVETLRDLSFNADGLRKPADELGLTLYHSDWMALDEGEGVLADPRVIAALSSRDVLVDRHNSDVIELAPDHFVVVHVDEHRPAELLPFDEVREEVVAAATRDRAEQLASDKARELVTAVRAGEHFAEVAERERLTWQRAQKVKRNAPDVADEILDLAFSLPHPQGDTPLVVQATLEGGNAVVMALETVEPGAIEDMDPRQREALQGQLAANNGQAAIAAYLDRIQHEAKIERM